MPHYSEDRCTNCNKFCDKELLTIKRVAFYPRTKSQKAIKNRTVAWLCEECRDVDPDWKLKAFEAPGHTSAPLERVRTDRGK